jgi:hypothetical protein
VARVASHPLPASGSPEIAIAASVTLALAASAGSAVASTTQTRTTFEFKQPIALPAVVSALDAAQLRPVGLRHTGSTQGGYQLGSSESLGAAAGVYQRAYERLHGGVPQIIAVTVPGASVPPTDLGALTRSVKRQYDMPSPTAEDPAPTTAATIAAGASKDWAPLYGSLLTIDIGGDLPREFQHQLLWEN